MYPASVEYLNRQRIIPNWGGGFGSNNIHIFSPFSLFVSAYVYASVCHFVCIALLLPFVQGFCLSIFFYYLKKFFFLIIILYFLFYFILFYFILFYFIFFLSSFFFLPFILSCVDDRALVLQPRVMAVPLRWESQVQDISQPQTSQLQVISNSVNLPEISIWMPRPSSTQRPARYRAGHPMPNN